MLDTFYVSPYTRVILTLTSHSFVEWLISQDDGLFVAYFDKLLSLLADEDKGVQKSALSNIQLVL